MIFRLHMPKTLKGQPSFLFCSTEAKFLGKLLELASYGKFGLSRPDLEPAKGKCLVRKVRDNNVFIELYQGSSIFLY